MNLNYHTWCLADPKSMMSVRNSVVFTFLILCLAAR